MRLVLVFGVHNHQPAGNFSGVIEENFQKAYWPFFQVLEKHPDFKCAVHFSGFLFSWIFENHPELVEVLKELLARGQIELWTGGFYEPILPAIPDHDKIGQIKMLSDFIEEKFGVKPRGMWLAERVWEPHLPKPLKMAGVEYTAVDDTHFLAAGFAEEELNGYFITEEQGFTLKIFPIDKNLRYLIPFGEISKIEKYLKERFSPGTVVTFFDDGEKFGAWPGTYRRVYQQGWLDEFFSMIEEADWIETWLPSRVIESMNPVRRCYLPTASYEEMGVWAFPAGVRIRFEELKARLAREGVYERYRNFLAGCLWRNFLVKYVESNNMHKKALHVSYKVESIKDSKTKQKAQRFLWTGQTNCPYWHGEFGGVYIKHLRRHIYQNLIKAEKVFEEWIHKDSDWLEVEEKEFSCGGLKELLISTPVQNVYITPIGAQVFEWDHKKCEVNLLDVMNRHREAYHSEIQHSTHEEEADGTKSIHDIKKAVPPEARKYLVFDWYRRIAFIDHFIHPNETLHTLLSVSFNELGDFLQHLYELNYKKSAETVEVEAVRDGLVLGRPLKLEKKLMVGKEFIEAVYNVPAVENVDFAVEFNFLSSDPSKGFLKTSKSRYDFEQQVDERGESFEIGDELLGWRISVESSMECRLNMFPIRVVSGDVDRFVVSHQGVSVWLRVPLAGGVEEWRIKLTIL